MNALVARAVGVTCIAVGFVLGIEGLANPESGWLRVALALIATGLLAQLYGMYAAVRHRRARERESRPSRPEDERGGGQGG